MDSETDTNKQTNTMYD